MFKPKLLTCLKDYSFPQFRSDVIAGVIVGVVALPLAIARTATNVHNGGRTPVAGMVHALTLALIMYLFFKWAVYIPMAFIPNGSESAA
ncbi:MAG: SulP family inorganic anion transporter [Candidatus Omnitrophota bacterium]|nr:SulP family inorganic anion transporter [Candidatus Omnitrophota bacterium]